MEKLIGLYWYCNDYHPGQWSWQYKVLCNSSYVPGYNCRGIESESEESQAYYHKLIAKFEKQ